MLEYIVPATGLLFTIQNILWINLGVFIGAVFAAIPGLSVILCVILFLPVTYSMSAIPGMMFLLGIYCAGGYGGSVSAILINTPGTPHAAATMLDGHPLSQQGRTKAALKIALYASTFGGVFSALMLLFLGPQVARVAAQLGTPEYFMVCVFGLTIIAGVSGKSMIRGIISACLGLLIACIGADPMTSYDRFTFGVPRLYLGLDLAVCLIGLFALVEILAKAEKRMTELHMDTSRLKDDGHISRSEYKRMVRPVLLSSLIGVIIGIIPGTGASEASWFSYSQAKNMSRHPEEFGHGSVEGIAAAESANNAVTGATLIPLLTLGIPGDGTVALMLSALMINRLNPGLSLFTTDGDIMYAIMLGLILVNLFMLLQGWFLTSLFAKVVSIPQDILTPIIVIFCFAGAYSVNNNYFDVGVALVFGVLAWILRKLDMPPVPILLGLVLGKMTETNFRRALLISNGNPSIFFSSIYCLIFVALIVVAVATIVRGKLQEQKKERAAAAGPKEDWPMPYNIVFYFTDQQRWDTCGCFGQPLNITPNLDRLAEEGVKFNNAFSAQPVCGPCRALFQTGRYPTETGCFRNNIMLPRNVKTLANYIEEAGYETAYVGKWHLASDGELEKPPTIDHTITAVPRELRGGYTGYWRAADVLEFTSHGYDGYVFDENNNRVDFQGYRADCINDMALEFLDGYDGKKPFFLTVSQIEPHHQNDHNHYEGPEGSKERFKNFVLPPDLQALGGNAAEEYPDYLGQCASLDENLGRLVAKLKEKGLYENTVILFVSDHGSHFKTRNTDSHLNGYDDYKRTCHDGALHVPLVIAGGPYKGGVAVEELVSTESLPKTILAIAGVDVGDAMIGENLLDVVRKKNDNRPNQVFAQISESRVGRCIRTPDFLYSVYAPGVNGGAAASADTYADDFLYDLKADPWQLHNVVDDPAYNEAKRDLRDRLLDWIEKAEGARPVILDKE